MAPPKNTNNVIQGTVIYEDESKTIRDRKASLESITAEQLKILGVIVRD